jgi:3-isopropylmalate/(R)-2-methylmalate dehydratase large subunit
MPRTLERGHGLEAPVRPAGIWRAPRSSDMKSAFGGEASRGYLWSGTSSCKRLRADGRGRGRGRGRINGFVNIPKRPHKCFAVGCTLMNQRGIEVGKTLYEKVFDQHVIRTVAPGQYQLFIGLHLVHEVTTPQGFAELKARDLPVLFPSRTFATADHVTPTTSLERPFADEAGEAMLQALETNVGKHAIRYFSPQRKESGIVHVIGPERGLTQPGMTIVCGDSHTSTHGAFGALAFGIGTSQVRDVLASQTLLMEKLKVRRIEVTGRLKPGVTAKDVALYLISKMGMNAGVGFAHEYGGSVIESMTMDERMTLCNMSVEGGARCGYVNPDEVTYAYLKGREYSPKEEAWERAKVYWTSLASDADAVYDEVTRFDGATIEPMVSWGITPAQTVGVQGRIPLDSEVDAASLASYMEALEFMDVRPGASILGTKIDVAFIGSCTNARLSDFEEVAEALKKSKQRVPPDVRALVVPGSNAVRQELIAKGLDKVFLEAGFSFREAGCSMCLAMNPDRLEGREVCASSSNRNFKGRQGSPAGRTLLMSPIMVAAAAVRGHVADAREVFGLQA